MPARGAHLRPRGTAAPSAQSGMALILALAAVALAGGLAFWMQARSMAAQRAAARDVQTERLHLAAAEAVRLAMLTLQEDDDYSVDSPSDAWAQPCEWTNGDGIALHTVTEDAARWFDWNNLSAGTTNSSSSSRTPRAVLVDLMAACGRFDGDARAEALADYVDADSEGAYEAPFYSLADHPFAPPDRPLWAPDELFDVHDFTPGLFLSRGEPTRGGGWTDGDLSTSCALVPAPFAGGVRPINLNTANRAVLLGVLGPDREQAVRALMALRAVQPLESAAMLSAVDASAATELEPWAAVSSPHFRIRARAALPDGSAAAGVEAWVERGPDGQIRVLQWLETEGGAA